MRGLRWWFSTGGGGLGGKQHGPRGSGIHPGHVSDQRWGRRKPMKAGPRRGLGLLGASPAVPQRKRLCAHVVLPLRHLLRACGCSVLLHLTLTPAPEARWVMMRQAPGLWDASEGGAERCPLWRGSGELAGTVVGPGGCMQHRGCLKNSERLPHVLLPGVRSGSVAAARPSHPRAARHLV